MILQYSVDNLNAKSVWKQSGFSPRCWYFIWMAGLTFLILAKDLAQPMVLELATSGSVVAVHRQELKSCRYVARRDTRWPWYRLHRTWRPSITTPSLFRCISWSAKNLGARRAQCHVLAQSARWATKQIRAAANETSLQLGWPHHLRQTYPHLMANLW